MLNNGDRARTSLLAEAEREAGVEAGADAGLEASAGIEGTPCTGLSEELSGLWKSMYGAGVDGAVEGAGARAGTTGAVVHGAGAGSRLVTPKQAKHFVHISSKKFNLPPSLPPSFPLFIPT